VELTGRSPDRHQRWGEPIDLHVIIHNSGTDSARTFRYEVWLSDDKKLDVGTDKKFHTGTLNLGGARPSTRWCARCCERGDASWYYLLDVDPVGSGKPAGDVTEATRGTTSGLDRAAGHSAADLIVENITVRAPVRRTIRWPGVLRRAGADLLQAHQRGGARRATSTSPCCSRTTR